MPIDSGGNITRPGPVPVDGQIAIAEHVNAPVNDLYAASNQFPFLDGRKSWRGNQNLNGYRFTNAANAQDPQDYVTLGQLQSAIDGVSGLFPGFLQVDTVSSIAAPNGWIYANGGEHLRSDYPELWARVQAGNNLAATQISKTFGQYGPGDGSTTFTVPNLYADGGYFIRPMSSGRTIGSVQQDENKSHTHTGSTNVAGSHTHNYTSPASQGVFYGTNPTSLFGATTTGTTTAAGAHDHTLSINASGDTEGRPKNIAYPVLIKAS